MKIIYSLKDFEETFAVREYQDGYPVDDKTGIREDMSCIKSELSNGVTQRLLIDGAIISFITRDREEDIGFYVRTDGAYLQMHFEIEGSTLYTALEKEGMDCRIPKGSHCLFYFPVLNGHLLYPKVKNGFSVQIEISLAFLSRAFNDDLEILGNFASHIRNEQPVMLGGRSFPMTGRIKAILMEMYHCPYTGQIKKIFIEGKLLELLCLQVTQITNTGLSDHFSSANDLEQMAMVKDIIQASLEKPYSIEELARMIGLNRTKLQYCFKKVYGNTIFGYITDLRMDLAKELLLEDRHFKIAEIARKIGYKNPNHFSAAFKKKFGELPSSHYRNFR